MHERPPFPGDLLEHLRALSAVAPLLAAGEAGAIGRAARDLAIDASVLRRRLAALASWLGGPIVAGRGPRAHLTARGAAALERGERVLAAVDALGPRDLAEPPRVTVACTGTFTAELLPQVFGALRGRFPGLILRVRRAGARLAERMLAAGDADVALVRAESPPAGFRVDRLGRDRLWLAAAASSPLARAARLDRRALAREPVITYAPGSFTRRRTLDVLAPLGARALVEVDGKSAALRWVQHGLGVAFVSLLPREAPAHPSVVLRDVTALFPKAAFYMLRPRRAALAWEDAFAEGVRAGFGRAS
jgi:DNA-binding transcriptional LysR family regulator